MLERMWRKGNPLVLLVEMSIGTATMRTAWRFLKKKLGIKLLYDPAIPLLGIYLEKTTTEKDTCTPVLTVKLFSIIRTQKPARYPLTDEQTKKMWYPDTMEYYSAIKRNKFESVIVTWLNLEPATQSKCQKEKSKYILTHVYGIYKNNTDKPICR